MLNRTASLLQYAYHLIPGRETPATKQHLSYTALMPVDDIVQQAEDGAAEQQYVLGNLYAQGEYFTQDYQQAAHWFYRSARQHHAGAMYKMGLCFEHGYGVSKDETEAMRWFLAAQNAGYSGMLSARPSRRHPHFILLTLAMMTGYVLAQFI